MWTHFERLRTKLLLTTFYDFLTRHFKKKRKKSRFLKSGNNVKYVFSHTDMDPNASRDPDTTRACKTRIVVGKKHLRSRNAELIHDRNRWPWMRSVYITSRPSPTGLGMPLVINHVGCVVLSAAVSKWASRSRHLYRGAEITETPQRRRITFVVSRRDAFLPRDAMHPRY